MEPSKRHSLISLLFILNCSSKTLVIRNYKMPHKKVMARATYKTRHLTEISPKMLDVDLENVVCCMK